MAIPIGPHGIREETPDNLIIDTGIVYRGGNLTQLRTGDLAGAISGASLMGALREQMTYRLNRSYSNIADRINGARGPLAGMDRVEGMRPEMEFTLIEHTLNNVMDAHGVADSVDRTNFNEVTARLTVEDRDYIDNLMIVGITGAGDDVIFVIENALNTNDFEVEMEDKGEAGLDCKFEGRFALTSVHDVPAHAFYPISLEGS